MSGYAFCSRLVSAPTSTPHPGINICHWVFLLSVWPAYSIWQGMGDEINPLLYIPYIVLIIRFMCSQKWNCAARPCSQFLHSCVYERFINYKNQSASLAAEKKEDRSWEYINRSQTHDCGNWETERYNSVLEITGAQFNFWEYIIRNQKFILDSHRPPSFAVYTRPSIKHFGCRTTKIRQNFWILMLNNG